MEEKHSMSISNLQAQLQNAEANLSSSRYEKDEVTKKLDQLEVEYQSLETELSQSKIVLLESKKSLETLEDSLTESKKSLEIVSNQKAAVESQKSELEEKLTLELVEAKGAHSENVAKIQSRLHDTVSTVSVIRFPFVFSIMLLTQPLLTSSKICRRMPSKVL